MSESIPFSEDAEEIFRRIRRRSQKRDLANWKRMRQECGSRDLSKVDYPSFGPRHEVQCEDEDGVCMEITVSGNVRD